MSNMVLLQPVLGGLDWNISKNLDCEQMLVPEDSIMFKNSDDTYNLRFSSYKKKQAKNEVDDFITYDDPDTIWILKNPLNKVHTDDIPAYLEKIESGNPDVDDLIRLLEKDQIFGSNPQQHWEKNKLVCKLKIKDPGFRITNKKITATNENIAEFKMHIDELLKLNVIRRSVSPHRSPTFIVNKHSEQVRGKTRMVIDYRRLNDNIEDDSYDIPDKTELINSIQGSIFFSKFNCKSGFWQIRMAEESIPWTAFTCPLGSFCWSMPLRLMFEALGL